MSLRLKTTTTTIIIVNTERGPKHHTRATVSDDLQGKQVVQVTALVTPFHPTKRHQFDDLEASFKSQMHLN